MGVLALVLRGDLREVNEKNGKELGMAYCMVKHCNYAELQGAKMEEEMAKQKEKASKKGLKAVEKKWYWVWYASKADAEDSQRQHFPDSFIPLTAIANVHITPGRSDQFSMKYHGGQAENLIYRRTSGKG